MVVIKHNFQKIISTTNRKIFGLAITFLSIPVTVFLFINFEFINKTMGVVLIAASSIVQLFFIGYYTKSVECLFGTSIDTFIISKKIFWFTYKKKKLRLGNFHTIKSEKVRMMYHSGFFYSSYVVYILGNHDSYEIGTVETSDELEKIKELAAILRLEYRDH